MIRAVLDTNVLASGIVEFAVAVGPPARLLHLWKEQRFELVVSANITTELINTLGAPYFRQRLTDEQISEARRLLDDEAIATPLLVHVSGVATHHEDDLVLAAAISAKADYLVTEDKRLLRIGSFEGVTLLSPRQFLGLLDPSGSDP